MAILGAHDIITQKQGGPTRYNLSQIIVVSSFGLFYRFVTSTAITRESPSIYFSTVTGLLMQVVTPNDIALPRLSMAANVSSKYIEPITMADPSSGDFAGHNCTIIGWGLFGVLSIFLSIQCLEKEQCCFI